MSRYGRTKTGGRFTPQILLCALCICVALCFAVPSAQAEERRISARDHHEERILAYHVDLYILPDAALGVRERITVRADGRRIQRGIYRDFPLRSRNEDGGMDFIGFQLKSLTRDGVPEPYHIEYAPGWRTVYAGREGRRVAPGVYTYEFIYISNRAVSHSKESDRLYWNVTGNNWVFFIDRATATVHLPDGAKPLGYTAFTGRDGAAGQDFTAAAEGGTIHFKTTQELRPKEGLTVSVSWPSGYVTPPARLKALTQILYENIISVGAIVVAFAVNFYMFLLWWFVGRGPKKGTIIPHFAPPDGFSPVLCNYLHKRSVYTSTAFTAALVNLAVKNHIHIRQVDRTGYEITRYKTDTDGLPPGEKYIMEHLFTEKKNSVVLTGGRDKHIEKVAQGMKELIEKENKKQYFICNEKPYLIGAIPAFLFFMLYMQAEYFLAPEVAVSLALILIPTVIYGFIIWRPTERGRLKLDHLLGFKLYLETAEKKRFEASHPPEMTPELFEKYLPYAIALEVENKWAAKFKSAVSPDVYKTYRTRWYSANGSFSTTALTRNLSSGFRSSLRSAGGGGSSGGGRGGGGGGGW